MKRLFISMLIILTMLSFEAKSQSEETNDFYDNAETYSLFGPEEILIEGEIANAGIVDMTKFEKRSVIVKETVLDGDKNKFVGAYRFDGYSIYDLLNDRILKKKNEEHFKPIIDLFVIIENEKGESCVLSWGEIYYPIHRHEIIIATNVARIVPSKTNELWPLPTETRLIVASDLITERNISMPIKITVVSAENIFEVRKGLKPMYSPDISIFKNNKEIISLKKLPKNIQNEDYEAIFYGRGRGIHSTTPFKGGRLKDILKPEFEFNIENIKHGIFVIAAEDGYRGVFTYSELMNRNDQSEILLIEDIENKDGGAFRLFPSCDFFSDRAIKSAKEIHYSVIKK